MGYAISKVLLVSVVFSTCGKFFGWLWSGIFLGINVEILVLRNKALSCFYHLSTFSSRTSQLKFSFSHQSSGYKHKLDSKLNLKYPGNKSFRFRALHCLRRVPQTFAKMKVRLAITGPLRAYGSTCHLVKQTSQRTARAMLRRSIISRRTFCLSAAPAKSKSLPYCCARPLLFFAYLCTRFAP